MESDESAVWLQAQAGDTRALAAVFDEHHRRVYRHALVLLGSTADADEIMAAAFLELWRRRLAVRVVNGSVLPWLLVTTTNLVRNRRRALLRYQNLLASLPAEPDVDPADVATEQIAAAQVRTRVAIALRTLHERDATLFALTVFEGTSTVDAAAVVGLSAATARQRLKRARARLRLHLADLAPDRYELIED